MGRTFCCERFHRRRKSQGFIVISLRKTLCEDGDLSNMDIGSRHVDTLDDALGLLAKCVVLAPYSNQKGEGHE